MARTKWCWQEPNWLHLGLQTICLGHILQNDKIIPWCRYLKRSRSCYDDHEDQKLRRQHWQRNTRVKYNLEKLRDPRLYRNLRILLGKSLHCCYSWMIRRRWLWEWQEWWVRLQRTYWDVREESNNIWSQRTLWSSVIADEKKKQCFCYGFRGGSVATVLVGYQSHSYGLEIFIVTVLSWSIFVVSRQP